MLGNYLFRYLNNYTIYSCADQLYIRCYIIMSYKNVKVMIHMLIIQSQLITKFFTVFSVID